MAAAWDLTETLIFERAAQGQPSLARLSVATGVSVPTLKGWEEGEWLPGLGPFVAWAQALGYEVALIPQERRE
jgi:transcriptional regulator with XRE-family HTH domain